MKLSTEDARWGIREAAWNVEERVLWRASDATRAAVRRALHAVEPLQRLIQTRLVWPLTDRLEDYGTGTRTALATLGVVTALGAAAAGSQLATDAESPGEPLTAAVAAELAAPAQNLRGVTPDFAGADTAAKAKPVQAPVSPAATTTGADAPPDQVAWRFAQAFVLYEVGKADKEAVTAFRETAAPPLAKSLGTDPPRLPQGTKVPQAKVLNIVMGAERGKEMTVSVSLLRLEAASELRLTLRESKKGWRVAGVLG